MNPRLSPLFKHKQVEAAKILGIAPYTLRQACYELGIGRWPWRIVTRKRRAVQDTDLDTTSAASGAPNGVTAETTVVGSVTHSSDTMLLCDHGRRWKRQNTQHGGLLNEALEAL